MLSPVEYWMNQSSILQFRRYCRIVHPRLYKEHLLSDWIQKKNQIRLVKNAFSSGAYFFFKEVEAIDRFRIVSTAQQ
jgi:hypothetical protein